MKGKALLRTTLTMLLLFAVLGVQSAFAEKVTITHLGYAGHGDAWRQFIDEAASKFMAENPDIKVEILVVAGSPAYREKFQVLYSTGTGLDIVEMGWGWNAVQYAADGMFLNLLPYIDKDPDVDTSMWAPPTLQGYTYNDQLWGLPAAPAVWMTWYNEDLFNNAGLKNPNDLGNNWNWDALTQAAVKMTQDTNLDGQPDQYGMHRPWHYWYYGMAAVAGGAQLYERTQLPIKPNFNTPEAKNAFRFVTDLYLRYKVAPAYDMPSKDANLWNFYNGLSGIDVSDNPGIMGAYLKNATFNWDVASPVRGPAGQGTQLTVDGFEIMSNSKHPDAAWKWLKYIMARKESVLRFMELTGRLPAYLGIHSAYPKMVSYAPKHWMKIFDTIGASTTQPIYVHRASGINNWRATGMLNEVFTGKKSPDIALDEAQELEVAAINAFLSGK